MLCASIFIYFTGLFCVSPIAISFPDKRFYLVEMSIANYAVCSYV